MLQTYQVIIEVDNDHLENELHSSLESELGWIDREGIEIKEIRNEPRAYLVNAHDLRPETKIGSCDFMTQAEKAGTVWSLSGFEKAFNNDRLNLADSFIYIDNTIETKP